MTLRFLSRSLSAFVVSEPITSISVSNNDSRSHRTSPVTMRHINRSATQRWPVEVRLPAKTMVPTSPVLAQRERTSSSCNAIQPRVTTRREQRPRTEASLVFRDDRAAQLPKTMPARESHSEMGPGMMPNATVAMAETTSATSVVQ